MKLFHYDVYSGYDTHKKWGVYRPDGSLLCVTTYKRGAVVLTNEMNEALGLMRSANDLLVCRNKERLHEPTATVHIHGNSVILQEYAEECCARVSNHHSNLIAKGW